MTYEAYSHAMEATAHANGWEPSDLGPRRIPRVDAEPPPVSFPRQTARPWTPPRPHVFVGMYFVPLRGTVKIGQIQRAVAFRFDIPIIEMTSDRRARAVARPRQVAMYLSKSLTPKSLAEIGRKFGGRDHTTVMHAIRQIDLLRAIDPALDAAIRELSSRLREGEAGR